MGTPNLTIEGRLTADPELRFLPSGKAVASFTVATSDSRKDDTTGEWTETAKAFFNVTCWEKLGENAAESLKKGDEVVVIGKMSQREYTTKEGDKRTSYQEVRAFNLGPSLRNATATSNRAARGSAAPAAAVEDPWATVPPVGASSAEPPF